MWLICISLLFNEISSLRLSVGDQEMAYEATGSKPGNLSDSGKNCSCSKNDLGRRSVPRLSTTYNARQHKDLFPLGSCYETQAQ